jgi:hypothetical protein
MAAKGQVNCHCCSGNCRKSGAYRNKNRVVQRFFCDRCGKSYSESQPLDGLRVDFKQACQVVNLLCESMGIRAVSRMDMATTCHAELTNLSVRQFSKRFNRCTLGYSKKLENLKHAVALFIWHFNYCRKHSAHGQTPAQAASLTDHQWKIEDLLNWTN